MAEDEENKCDDDGEGELQGHMADYLFDEKSLVWIEKSYGNSMNFMHSFGLKFYNDEDCAEAQSIAHAMKEDDD